MEKKAYVYILFSRRFILFVVTPSLDCFVVPPRNDAKRQKGRQATTAPQTANYRLSPPIVASDCVSFG